MDRKKVSITILICVVILGGGYIGWIKLSPLVFKNDAGDPRVKAGDGKSINQAIAINGLIVSEALAVRKPLAVMIENLPDARPQSGLADADIVYEALAEGGVTRFLAIYQSKDVAKVGPVRSAREYFAELANPWEALFVHVGGSPKALTNLASGTYATLVDLNQFYHSEFFERVKDRPAPHNVYTSTEQMYKFLGTQTVSTSIRRSLFTFKPESPVVKSITQNSSVKSITVVPAYTVTIDFSTSSYGVTYKYDGEKNEYQRFIAGRPDIDKESQKPITAKTIIAQVVDVTPIPKDPQLRVDTKLTGQGRAVLFMDGLVIEGLWKRTAKRIVYTDVEGKEIAINAGPIWVELVPKSKEATFKWEGAVVNPDGSVKVGNPFSN